MQPQFANIATPSEIVVATTFTLEIGDASGTIHFCIPYATLEPIRDVLYSTIQGDSTEPDRRWVKLMKQQIQSAKVELVAELAHAPATVEQLLSFKAGDFIELDLKHAIQAKVAGVPVFDCHYGISNGKYALKVDQLLTSSEPRLDRRITMSAEEPSGRDARRRRRRRMGRRDARAPKPPPSCKARPTRCRRRRSRTSRRPPARRPATTST